MTRIIIAADSIDPVLGSGVSVDTLETGDVVIGIWLGCSTGFIVDVAGMVAGFNDDVAGRVAGFNVEVTGAVTGLWLGDAILAVVGGGGIEGITEGALDGTFAVTGLKT